MIHGGSSHKRLATCHTDLQKLVLAAAEDFDLIVLCGHRGEQDQEAAFRNGTTQLHWPKSRHNSDPSEAVDLAPFPLNWQDLGRFRELGRHILAKADGMGLAITWGGSWRTLVDLPHYELTRTQPNAALA